MSLLSLTVAVLVTDEGHRVVEFAHVVGVPRLAQPATSSIAEIT